MSVGKVEIQVSTEKVESGQVPEKGLGEMLENPKQAKRSKQTQGKEVGLSKKSNTIMTKEGGMPQYDNRKFHK